MLPQKDLSLNYLYFDCYGPAFSPALAPSLLNPPHVMTHCRKSSVTLALVACIQNKPRYSIKN